MADLTKALRDKDFSIRRDALAALAKLGPEAKATVGEMVRLLRDDLDADDAAQALAAIGAVAVPPLRAALKHKDERLRINAAMALGLFETDAEAASRPLLETLKGDRSQEVRGMAARSLGRLKHKPEDVLVVFRTFALGKNAEVALRIGIADGIAEFGPEARAAMDVLVQEAK